MTTRPRKRDNAGLKQLPDKQKRGTISSKSPGRRNPPAALSPPFPVALRRPSHETGPRKLQHQLPSTSPFDITTKSRRKNRPSAEMVSGRHPTYLPAVEWTGRLRVPTQYRTFRRIRITK